MSKITHRLLIVLLALGSSPLLAQDDALVGSFGHEFTRVRDIPVWLVSHQPAGYRVRRTGDDNTFDAHEWTEGERAAFWERMWWPPTTSSAARCVGTSEEVICYVPASARKQIAWLSGYKSDYFNHSEMGGVMEIRRVSH